MMKRIFTLIASIVLAKVLESCVPVTRLTLAIRNLMIGTGT